MSTLRTRLFASIGIAVVASMALALVVGGLLVRRSYDRTVLAELVRQVDLLAARAPGLGSPPRGARGAERVLAHSGELVRAVPLPLPRGAPITAAQVVALEAGGTVSGTTVLEGRPVLFAAAGLPGRVLLLARPARLGRAEFRPFVVALLVAGAVGVAAAAIVSFVLATRIAEPVHRVAEASRRLAAGASPEPVPVEGTAELATMAVSFNDMASELARAREAEQSFLLSVSHELKTPLTAIRGYAEGVEEGVVSPPEAAAMIRRESASLERLIQDLLDLGRLHRRAFTVRRERVDLGTVAEDAVRRHEASAREFGVALSARRDGSAAGLGDPDRLLQVVSNLVENALRSTPRGGEVTVVAAESRLTVRDTGPGIAPEHLPRAFERFYLHRRRTEDRAVGSGLGLAIVKELTEAMGGTVGVESRIGQGTAFTVRLPAPPDREGGAHGEAIGS